MNGDDMCTVLQIISMAQHITRPPHIVSSPGSSATTSTAAASEISNEGSSEFGHESHEQLQSQLKMLKKDLAEVTHGFSRVSHVSQDVSDLFKSLEEKTNMLQSVLRDILLAPGGNTIFPADQVNASIHVVGDVVLKLKSQIPSTVTGILRVQSVRDLINHLVKMPTYQKYEGCSALQDFEKNYMNLDPILQKCLFCFSAFPEDFVVDKTLLMYWWVGEGWIDHEVNSNKIVEHAANEIVEQFMKLQFIEPVTENGKLIGLRMLPIVRYVVAYLAERANFFDFDFEWNPTSNFRLCQRACLIETADGSSQQQLIEDARLHPEKLRTLFNFNGRMVDITGKWFQKIRNVNVLYMGVWDEYFDHLFELRGSKSLKGLKRMKHLRFLGLQDFVTTSEFLKAIGKLENLRILTLRDWRGFFELKNSKSLQRLSHLEFGDLDRGNPLPKVIRQLPELQVLKGIGISPIQDFNVTLFDDLARLKKLRKLSINVSSHRTSLDITLLNHIKSLRKLTILWDGRPENVHIQFPILQGLQKLALRFCPQASCGALQQSFPNLQKLYIIEGEVRELPELHLSVKILRLTDLPFLNLDWESVTRQFSSLIYLQTNRCPNLISFPCDANGVWLNEEKLTEKKSLEELGFSWSFLASYPSYEQRV